jgi:hypothetical protein
MMTDLVKLFCSIHDFWIKFEPEWNAYSISQQKLSVMNLIPSREGHSFFCSS